MRSEEKDFIEMLKNYKGWERKEMQRKKMNEEGEKEE